MAEGRREAISEEARVGVGWDGGEPGPARRSRAMVCWNWSAVLPPGEQLVAWTLPSGNLGALPSPQPN